MSLVVRRLSKYGIDPPLFGHLDSTFAVKGLYFYLDTQKDCEWQALFSLCFVKLGLQPLTNESYLCFRHFLMPRKASQLGRQQVSIMTSLHETKSSSFPPFKQLEYFSRKLLHYQQNNTMDCGWSATRCPRPTGGGRLKVEATWWMSSSQTSCLDEQQHCWTETRSSRLWLSAGLSATCESFLSLQFLQDSNNLDLNGGLGPGTLMLALFIRSADQAKKQTLCSLLRTFRSALFGGEKNLSRPRPTRQPYTKHPQL